MSIKHGILSSDICQVWQSHITIGLSLYLFSYDIRGEHYAKGALAQLGERLICIQEVSGSIPLGSTNASCSFKVPDPCQEWVGSSGG